MSVEFNDTRTVGISKFARVHSTVMPREKKSVLFRGRKKNHGQRRMKRKARTFGKH